MAYETHLLLACCRSRNEAWQVYHPWLGILKSRCQLSLWIEWFQTHAAISAAAAAAPGLSMVLRLSYSKTGRTPRAHMPSGTSLCGLTSRCKHLMTIMVKKEVGMSRATAKSRSRRMSKGVVVRRLSKGRELDSPKLKLLAEARPLELVLVLHKFMHTLMCHLADK